ncbi:MAG: GspE/PulE family protein [Burkholderiaceae bacterium]|nr:GspE/PulE family protein [Burkholderiaceae bacterium]
MSAVEMASAQRVRWRSLDEQAFLGIVQHLESSALAWSDRADQQADESSPSLLAGDELSLAALDRSDSDVIRRVHAALYDGIRLGASDVHFETVATGLQVKYRLDGVLSKGPWHPGVVVADEMLSRLKIMADLDIAERRIPQDGRFRMNALGRQIDFRISVMPSALGEDAVVRILDKHQLSEAVGRLTLAGLGLAPQVVETLHDVGEQPHGLILLTGPTGSGKTTTLYALLSETNTGAEKIITIEDPIEYQIPGILQIPVNEKKGLTFARGLRSILRHDPDRIMVGEIRDSETAEIAVQSALTGHLVLSTVHANNIFDVVGRFVHMGIDIANFVAALRCVMAQRLIRLNCSRCVTACQPDAALRRRSRLPENFGREIALWRGTGCEACHGTGYRGRRAIAELLMIDDDFGELIRDRAPISVLKEEVRRRGTRLLRSVALDLVLAGETSLEEANRVTLAA